MDFRNKAYNLIRALCLIVGTVVVVIISGITAVSISEVAIEWIKSGYALTIMGMILIIIDLIYAGFLSWLIVNMSWMFDDDSEHNSK